MLCNLKEFGIMVSPVKTFCVPNPLQQLLPSDQISEQDVLVQLSRPGVQIAQPVPHLDQVALETKRPVPPVGHCSTNYHEEQDYDWSGHVDGAV